MLMPALGFIVGCGFFGVVGALLLRLFRRQRLGREGTLVLRLGGDGRVCRSRVALSGRSSRCEGAASRWCRGHFFLRGPTCRGRRWRSWGCLASH